MKRKDNKATGPRCYRLYTCTRKVTRRFYLTYCCVNHANDHDHKPPCTMLLSGHHSSPHAWYTRQKRGEIL